MQPILDNEKAEELIIAPDLYTRLYKVFYWGQIISSVCLLLLSTYENNIHIEATIFAKIFIYILVGTLLGKPFLEFLYQRTSMMAYFLIRLFSAVCICLIILWLEAAFFSHEILKLVVKYGWLGEWLVIGIGGAHFLMLIPYNLDKQYNRELLFYLRFTTIFYGIFWMCLVFFMRDYSIPKNWILMIAAGTTLVSGLYTKGGLNKSDLKYPEIKLFLVQVFFVTSLALGLLFIEVV